MLKYKEKLTKLEVFIKCNLKTIFMKLI